MKNITSYGQHFLINDEIIKETINFSNLNKNDVVVEIGIGQGVLTKELAKAAKLVYAYEIDSSIKPQIDLFSKKHKNLVINFENALKATFPKFNKLISNLPYQITEPFIEKLVKRDFEFAVLLVGNNFAKSVCFDNDTETKLSLLTKCFFNCQYLKAVEKENFSPPPNTLSAIIKLTPLQQAPSKQLFVMKELFCQRDKKLKNALVEALIRLNHQDCNTQRKAKEVIKDQFALNFLENNFENITNSQIQELFNCIKNYVNS